MHKHGRAEFWDVFLNGQNGSFYLALGIHNEITLQCCLLNIILYSSPISISDEVSTFLKRKLPHLYFLSFLITQILHATFFPTSTVLNAPPPASHVLEILSGLIQI